MCKNHVCHSFYAYRICLFHSKNCDSFVSSLSLSLFFFFSSKDSGTSGSAQLEISSVNLNDAGITLIQLNDSPQFSSTPNDYPDTYYCIGILHQETVIDVLSFSIYQTYICVVVLISQLFILSWIQHELMLFSSLSLGFSSLPMKQMMPKRCWTTNMSWW